MGRVWRFFAAWGLDVLVVAAAAASAIGTLLRDDADRPDGLALWLEVAARSACVLLALLCPTAVPLPRSGVRLGRHALR